MTKYIFWILLIFLLLNCSDKEHEGQRINIVSETIQNSENGVSFWKIELIDSLIVGYNFRERSTNGNIIYLLNQNLQTVNKFGKIGKGPGEIQVLGPMTIDKKSKLIYIGDAGDNTLKGYDITEISDESTLQIAPKNVIQFENWQDFACRKRIIFNNMFIQSGQDNEHLIKYYNLNGKFEKSIGRDFIDQGHIPSMQYNLLMDHDFAYNPIQNRFVIFYQFFDDVIVIDNDGNEIYHKNKGFHNSVKYDEGYRVNPVKSVRKYYGIAHDNRFIFARYLNRPLYEGKAGDRVMQYSNIIHVYNWDGDIEYILELDSDIAPSFLLNDRNLICLNPTSENQWLIFDIDDLYEE